VRLLQELSTALAGTPPELIRGHLLRHDFSRWIQDVFRDAELALRVRELEDIHAGTGDFGPAAIRAIAERYLPSSTPA
jgi:hypothetical protein